MCAAMSIDMCTEDVQWNVQSEEVSRSCKYICKHKNARIESKDARIELHVAPGNRCHRSKQQPQAWCVPATSELSRGCAQHASSCLIGHVSGAGQHAVRIVIRPAYMSHRDPATPFHNAEGYTVWMEGGLTVGWEIPEF